MLKEILSVTIDGKTYREYKKAYESIKNNYHAVCFSGSGFNYQYAWEFYTKDEVLLKMQKEYEFMCSKFIEEKRNDINSMKEEIKLLMLDKNNLIKNNEKYIEVINEYLNAGCKETRKKASDNAKVIYKEYYGKDYQNKE